MFHLINVMGISLSHLLLDENFWYKTQHGLKTFPLWINMGNREKPLVGIAPLTHCWVLTMGIATIPSVCIMKFFLCTQASELDAIRVLMCSCVSKEGANQSHQGRICILQWLLANKLRIVVLIRYHMPLIVILFRLSKLLLLVNFSLACILIYTLLNHLVLATPHLMLSPTSSPLFTSLPSHALTTSIPSTYLIHRIPVRHLFLFQM